MYSHHLYIKGKIFSVRGSQYKADIAVNAKIPDEVVHKLPFHMLRIKFEWLCSHPFNFENYGIFEMFSAITAISGSIIGKFKIFFTKPFIAKTNKVMWVSWKFKNNNRSWYIISCSWSSELSSQNTQILRKLSEKCQIFTVLRIRPKGQRPNSKPFKG